jgi:hypothetical protein
MDECLESAERVWTRTPLWTPRRLGGLGTKPECSVKSIDRFPTSLSRIQVEIKGQGKVPLLKSRYGGAPSARDAGRPVQAWAGLMDEGLENAEKGLDKDTALAAGPAGKGIETKPECAVKSTDGFLTSVLRIEVKHRRQAMMYP